MANSYGKQMSSDYPERCPTCGQPMPRDRGASLSCARDVYDYTRDYSLKDQEHFVVMCLSSRNKVLAERVVAIGTTNTVAVEPSDILRDAVKMGAVSIICVHNHPSGEVYPSPEDRTLTRRISKACEIMGIRLLDHVVIGAEGYYSFSDQGGV